MRRIAAMSSAATLRSTRLTSSWPSARASTETLSLLAPFACVASTLPCEGVVVVVVVSSEVAPVVPLFFVAAMWCIEPTGGRQTVGAKLTGTTTVRDKHTIQAVNVLSLYSMCPINKHYRGYL